MKALTLIYNQRVPGFWEISIGLVFKSETKSESV